MAVPLEQFVKHLEDSGVLAGDTLGDFIPPRASPKDAEELLGELLRQKKLTKFQAEQVWQGNGKSLVLGNYLLLEKIGQGGMGAVYKAEHRRMHRIVAIKMLPAAMTQDQSAIARFEREVTAAARLEHPNIVTAFDADQSGDVHFLVMQYIEGSDLAALVKKNGPLPVENAVRYILQAARGLEFAHGEGVVHRDIKPANLLLDKKGTVKILDMGLARINSVGDVAPQADLTGTGAVMGTVDFMSPEQALDTRTADARADIYSLGCSLFYLLTGMATYPGDTLVKKILAHREQPVPSLCAARPEAPADVETVFQKMVAKRPEERYQSMTELIAALEACGNGNEPTVVFQEPVGPGTGTGLTNFLKDIFSAPKKLIHTDKVAQLPIGKNKKRLLLIGVGSLGVLILLAGLVLKPKTEDGFVPVTKEFEIESGGRRPITANLLPEKSRQNWPSDAPPPAIAPFNAEQAKEHQEAWAKYLKVPVDYENSIGMKFRLIPPGEFMMGSTPTEIEDLRSKDYGDPNWRRWVESEGPEQDVVLSQPFFLGIHEVTQREYETIMGTNPSQMPTLAHENSQLCPVDSVSWTDALAFCDRLREKDNLQRAPDGRRTEGSTYRLPTNREWEYACRAGTTTRFWAGDDSADGIRAGWFATNSEGRPHDVGTRPGNPFGIFDMHGNASEWVSDFWTFRLKAEAPDNSSVRGNLDTRRVIRGGNWKYPPEYGRSASQLALHEDWRVAPDVGFRLALSIDGVR